MGLDIKINKQFLRISAIAFVLTLVILILNEIIYSVIRDNLHNIDFINIRLLNYLSISTGYTIGPILIFTVFYFVGTKPNPMFELKSILFALLIGNIASLFVITIISSIVRNVTTASIIEYGGGLMLIFLSVYVISALAGLFLGYIKLKNLMMKTEPEPSPNT